MRERTTKRVNASLTLTFHGDYVAADEIAGRLDAWIDRGFDDRDDLRMWKIEVQGVTEIHGDPDGYDS